ncbi:MFS transporter [Telmatocola sphagniphila]|uniref:MFS transporter n=1 Tax=Telmatocola sphagniphila TaxID=1123043 RepID=A0A8E6B998_9BACT|nr:MFS transporter [Telmatocola sphagniphila]
MISPVFFWSVISALAGFLFGFDTVVISGAEKTIQEIWKLDDQTHGFAIGSALWGTVLGSLIGGFPTQKFGRKRTLLSIGLFYVVGSLGSAFAQDVYTFMAARFLGGVAIGISTVASPLYISEISPQDRRGRLAGMFQFNIVFGILIAYASNAALSSIGENAWRWKLGVMIFPSILYTFSCFFIPKSPRWLISKKQDLAGAESILKLIYPADSHEELKKRMVEISQQSKDHPVTENFWNWKLRKPIFLAFMIAFFNQMSGINAILYYADRIFDWLD